MKYGLYIWLLLQLLCRSGVSAQELSGVVLGKKDNKPVENALVKTMASRNRMVAYTYTNGRGRFSLPDKPEADTLTVSCLGYETVSMPVGAFKAHATIYLSEKTFALKNVVVTPKRIVVRNDTLAYSVAGFSMPQDKSIADVIAKMPGFEIKENGRIEYNGVGINRFYIEGVDLMNDRYALAGNNLDRRKVKTVEVLRNHQPIAALRGKLFSEQAAVNLVLEDNAKLNFTGTADVGFGYNSDKSLLHDNRLIGMTFQKQRQQLTMYKSNNTGADIGAELIPIRLQLSTVRPSAEADILTPLTPSAGNALPGKRYTFNQSHLFATNHLYKVGKVTTLRAQGSYLYNDIRGYREVITDYLFAEPQAAIVHEDYRTGSIQNKYDASLTYEQNSRKLFVKNEWKASLTRQSDCGRLYLNANPVDIWVKPDKEFLRNDLQLTIPTSSSSSGAISVNSSVAYNRMPQSLLVLNDRVQNVTYRSLHADNTLTLRGKVLGLYVKNEFGYEYYRQSLITLSDGQEEKAVLSRSVPSWQSSLTLRKNSLRFAGTVGLKWWNIHSPLEKVSACLPEGSLSMRYEISGSNAFDLAYRCTQAFPDLQHIYGGLLYTGYRTAQINRAKVEAAPSHSVTARYEYSQPVDGLFMTASARVGMDKRNAVFYGTVQDNHLYLYSSEPASYYRKSANIHARISQAVNFWKTLFALSGSLIYTEDKRMNNHVIDNVYHRLVVGKLSISSRPARWLSVELNGSTTHSGISGPGLGSGNTRLVLDGNLFFIVNDALTIGWRNSGNRYMQLNQNVFFSDLSVTYKHRRVDYELTANNLLGKTSYQQDAIAVNYYVIRRYVLRPRDILLKVSFSF